MTRLFGIFLVVSLLVIPLAGLPAASAHGAMPTACCDHDGNTPSPAGHDNLVCSSYCPCPIATPLPTAAAWIPQGLADAGTMPAVDSAHSGHAPAPESPPPRR